MLILIQASAVLLQNEMIVIIKNQRACSALKLQMYLLHESWFSYIIIVYESYTELLSMG